MISFFRAPIRNTKPSAQASILQIYKYIISNRASDITRRLRAITDPKEARKYKSEAFDYVTFSGCFSSRCTDELIEHSGFLCFDIDKIESERRLQEIKSLLINDEELHTVLCFRSPSGNGLKWVVEVPDRFWLRQSQQSIVNGQQTEIEIINCNHRTLYERIRHYLLDTYGIDTDHTSDIARPCYLCYDDDAYYDEPTFKANPASEFLIVRNEECGVRNENTISVEALAGWSNKKRYCGDIETLVREIERRRIDITADYANWVRVGFALASICGVAGEHLFHRISQFHPKYDHNETHKLYNSCLKNNSGVVTIGTIVYLMKN